MQQVQLAEIGIVETPAFAQVPQQTIAQHEACGTLGFLLGETEQIGLHQVFREDVFVSGLEAE